MKHIVVESFARKAYRTLLIAYRDYSMAEYENLKDSNNNFATEANREILE